MQIEITKQEAWKLLDAIKSYTNDYAVNGVAQKIFNSITKKLEAVTNA